MAATPERKVKDQIKKVLDKYGADLYYCMPIGTGYGNSGVPDFVICYRSYFITVEAKANGGKPTELQKLHMEKITEAGGVALVIDESNIGHLDLTLTSVRTAMEMRHAP